MATDNIDVNAAKESVDALVNEALASHTVESALVDPDFKDIIAKYPQAWSKLNNVYTPEITKLKHIIFTINRHFQDLVYENKMLNSDLGRAKEEVTSLEKGQGKDIISFGGIKGRVIDLAKIIGMAIGLVILFLVICFGLAKIDPDSFDKVANTIERMVHSTAKATAEAHKSNTNSTNVTVNGNNSNVKVESNTNNSNVKDVKNERDVK